MPLVILCIGLIPVRLGFAYGAQPWLGTDALWLSFPASTFVNLVLAIIYFRQGEWRESRMAPPSMEECREKAEASAEPGGRLMPSG